MQNQKGQALLETLPLALVFILLTPLLLGSLYKASLKTIIDDALETHLICQIQKKMHSDCTQDLEKKLKQFKIHKDFFSSSVSNETYSVTLKYRFPFGQSVYESSRKFYFSKKI